MVRHTTLCMHCDCLRMLWMNAGRRLSVPSQFPDYIRQQQSVAYLSLSLPFIHEACWNKHFAKTMLSCLNLNLMQWESPPSPCRSLIHGSSCKVCRSGDCASLLFFSSLPRWHIMTITINRGSVKKWNVIAMVAHLILLCASCIYWLFSLTCIDYYAYC